MQVGFCAGQFCIFFIVQAFQIQILFLFDVFIFFLTWRVFVLWSQKGEAELDCVIVAQTAVLLQNQVILP